MIYKQFDIFNITLIYTILFYQIVYTNQNFVKNEKNSIRLIYEYNTNKFYNYNNTSIEDEKKYISLCETGTLLKKYPTREEYSKIKDIKISVVSPVYNAAKFIIPFLRSIQNQNFTDYEIILLDDCSTDNSLKIIEEEAKLDPRIKIYKNKQNMGVFYTKLTSMSLAKGKYIWPIDDDDDITNPNAFQILYETAEKYNLDVLHFAVLNGGIKKIKIAKQYCPKIINEYIDKPNFLELQSKMKTMYMLWNKIWRKDLITHILNKIGIKRRKALLLAEDDFIFNVAADQLVKRYMGIPNIFLWHRLHSNQSHSKIKSKKNFIKHFITFYNSVHMYYDLSKNDQKSKRLFKSRMNIFINDVNSTEGFNIIKKNKTYRNYVYNICDRFLKTKYLSSKAKTNLKLICKKTLFFKNRKNSNNKNIKYLVAELNQNKKLKYITVKVNISQNKKEKYNKKSKTELSKTNNNNSFINKIRYLFVSICQLLLMLNIYKILFSILLISILYIFFMYFKKIKKFSYSNYISLSENNKNLNNEIELI